MYNRYLKAALLSAACFTLPMAMTSCKDYGDDIDNLQGQIDKINVDLGKLQALISSGSVITSVNTTANGVAFTLSDGKTYELTNGKNGTNGTDGKDGKNGTVWTIGEDGFWYKDGAKTDYKAIGTDGKDGAAGPQGPQGPQGPAGNNGKDGKYYVPNQKTGNFDIYQDGKLVEETSIPWRGEGITAAYSGNELVLAGVKDKDGKDVSVKIPVGTALANLEFIPSVVSRDLPYPTTDEYFYYLSYYIDETKVVKGTDLFDHLTDIDKSNKVGLEYRMSPADAYIPTEATGTFINRIVEKRTRAEGDETNLLNCAGLNTEDGVLTAYATYNQSAYGTEENPNPYYIAAFQLWNGQIPFTTDYIAVQPRDVQNVYLVKADKKQGYPTLYTRNRVLPTKDLDKPATMEKFVKDFVTLDDPANVELPVSGSLDLNTVVGLYSNRVGDLLSNVGFDGITYKYYTPENYCAEDAQKTNQQWFINKLDGDGSVISVNTDNLTTGTSGAIGRTPVVRVDAYMTDNAGAEHMVASAYIKIRITGDKSEPQDITMPEITKAYKTLGNAGADADKRQIAFMGWQQINKDLYSANGLTSNTFWQAYYSSLYFKVTVEDLKTNPKKPTTKVLGQGYGDYNDNWNAYSFETETPNEGIQINARFNQDDVQTSFIQFCVDNRALTNLTYGEAVEGQGAKYTVTITFQSADPYTRDNIKITQVFYVKEDGKAYNPSPIYYNSTLGCVETKGKIIDGTWKLWLDVSEAFEVYNVKVGNSTVKQDVYVYGNSDMYNTDGIAFALNNPEDPKKAQKGVIVDPIPNRYQNEVNVKLTDPLTDPTKKVNLKYTQYLENGEYYTNLFDVMFNNPFKAGKQNTLTLAGNQPGAVTVDPDPAVDVVDLAGKQVYTWFPEVKDKDGHTTTPAGLYLTKLGNSYKPGTVTVKYAFDTEDQAYKDFVGQLVNGSYLKINDNGEVEFLNKGAALNSAHTVKLNAIVTFGTVCTVTCPINVTITAEQ